MRIKPTAWTRIWNLISSWGKTTPLWYVKFIVITCSVRQLLAGEKTMRTLGLCFVHFETNKTV